MESIPIAQLQKEYIPKKVAAVEEMRIYDKLRLSGLAVIAVTFINVGITSVYLKYAAVGVIIGAITGCWIYYKALKEINRLKLIYGL